MAITSQVSLLITILQVFIGQQLSLYPKHSQEIADKSFKIIGTQDHRSVGVTDGYYAI